MALWISEDGKLAKHKCFKCGSNDEYKDAVPRLAALERVAKAAERSVKYCPDRDKHAPDDPHDCKILACYEMRKALAELNRPSESGEKK